MTKHKYIIVALLITMGCLQGAGLAFSVSGEEEISRSARNLIEDLSSPQERARVNAAVRLANFDYIQVVRALMRAAAEDNSEMVRRVSLRSLGEIQNKQALDIILKSFNSESPAVRMQAMSASVAFSTPSVTEALVEKSTDSHPMVRQTAIESLGKVEVFTSDARKAVIDRLHDISEGVRVAAVRVAGERKMPQALFEIVEVLENDVSAVVRERAAAALAEFNDGREVVGALKNALDDQNSKVRINAALSLAESGSSAGLNTALAGINSSDARVRIVACRVIGKVGSERSKIFLERALEDMDSRVRRAARNAINEMEKRFE